MRLSRLSVTLVCMSAVTLAAVSAQSSVPFSHLSPANGAIVKSTSVLLTWSYGSFSNSEYCIDTVNNNVCDTAWISPPTTNQVQLNGLSPETTYYWQVRKGAVYAEGDPAAYWSFTTTGSRHTGVALGGLSDYPSHQALSISSSGIAVGWASGGSASGGPNDLAERFNPASQIYLTPGPPYDSATKAHSINDAGLISGYGLKSSLPAVYAGGGNWMPQLPGGVNQLGGYVNNAGEVVGTTYFDGSNATPGHATLWLPDGGGYSAVDLGLFNGQTIEPLGLAPNRSGSNRIIVGRYKWSNPYNEYTAIQWKDGVWSVLPYFACSLSSANAVSDGGIVVGQACGFPALWENGQVRFLSRECEMTTGAETGEARGIAVTPAGRILIVGKCGNQPAVWYSDGPNSYVCELLELLGSDTQGDAFDVNAAGQIVGSTKAAVGATHAAGWTFSEPSPVLTITRTGTGAGTVTSMPAGIDCGATCSLLFTLDQVVTLTATPAAGSVFSGFGGDIDCSDGQVTMYAARSCTATFTLGPGGGPISPLYMLGETLNGETINVLQGPTVKNSWLTFAETHSIFGGEGPFAVIDVLKTFSKYPLHSVSYSLAGDLLGVNLLNLAPYNPEQSEFDGASDGTHIYVTTSFGNVFRFDTNWNYEAFLFGGGIGQFYGITHDPSNNSLWVTSYTYEGGYVIHNYSMAGARLSTFGLSGPGFASALALDPADSTLWVLRSTGAGGHVLQQYSKQGLLLSAFDFPLFQYSLVRAEFARLPATPDAFFKISPTNWASGKSVATVLSWSTSPGATSHEYCIDTTNDNTCNGWIDVGTSTSASPAGLMPSTTYFWQVRAIHAGGTTYADGNSTYFWNFDTAAQPNPTLDLNGDGNGDAFLYNPSSGNWQRQVAQSNGSFAANNGNWAPDWTVVPATFDDDALSDLFLFNTTTGAWFKMLGSGGSFEAQSSGTWWNGWERHVMDLDGDGISDVFLYDPATGVWFECISTPTGFTYFQGGWGPNWEIYPMILNADGLGDMFLFNRTSGAWFWVIGEAGGGFSYPVNGTWFNGWNLYPGHFNTDKLSDLLLLDQATGAWFVAMNNGTGTGFTYTTGTWALGWTPYVGDLDNDQDDDLILHNPANGNWFELLSTGSGGFTNGGGSTWSLGWNVYPTDLNGDGRMDILLYNPSTGVWYQARNLVTGTFTYTTGTWLPDWVVIVRNPSP